MKKFRYLLLVLLSLITLMDDANALVNHPSLNKEKNKQKFNSDSSEVERLVLITGCARSGTSYAAIALDMCGLHLKHESSYGEHGIVSWFMAVDSAYQPYKIPITKCKFKHVFLQVRNPLKAIASIETEPMESWCYVQQFLPQIHLNEPNIIKAAKYWYYWNLMAEQKAEWIYRIEDLDLVINEMSERLGIDLDKNGLNLVPRNTNTRGNREYYKWEDLKRALDPKLYLNIVNMAKRYGYAVDTIPIPPVNHYSITPNLK